MHKLYAFMLTGPLSGRVARRPAGHVLHFDLMISVRQARLKAWKTSGFLYVCSNGLLTIISWQFLTTLQAHVVLK